MTERGVKQIAWTMTALGTMLSQTQVRWANEHYAEFERKLATLTPQQRSRRVEMLEGGQVCTDEFEEQFGFLARPADHREEYAEIREAWLAANTPVWMVAFRRMSDEDVMYAALRHLNDPREHSGPNMMPTPAELMLAAVGGAMPDTYPDLPRDSMEYKFKTAYDRKMREIEADDYRARAVEMLAHAAAVLDNLPDPR